MDATAAIHIPIHGNVARNIHVSIVRHQNMYMSSSTANFPLDILDAHFLTGLVIVVVPFAFGQIDGGERGVGLDAGSLEITL